MFNKSEKLFSGILFIICLVAGVLGYSYSGTDDPPGRVWFDTSGGQVIFAHGYHTGFLKCVDCHHDYDEKNPANEEMNCRACHYYGEGREMESSDSTHPRVIGAGCRECHAEQDEAISTCETCHIRKGREFEVSGFLMPTVPKRVTFEVEEAELKADFDHEFHMSEDVGEPCMTCHHEFKGGKGMEGMVREKSCRACHYKLADQIPEYEEDDHVHYIGANCVSCHEEEDCSFCHKE